MKDELRALIVAALEESRGSGAITLDDTEPVIIEITKAKEERFGHYATNVAMTLAKRARLKPRDLAAAIVDRLPVKQDVIERCDIAGPGFINFFLASRRWDQVLHDIHEHKTAYGHARDEAGPSVLMEFVSANPTGPLHVGHGRGAAVGDTLRRLLKARGYKVTAEYYVNDAGNQMRILGRSVRLRFRELQGEAIDFPDDHYRGDYIKDLAATLEQSGLGVEPAAMDEDRAIAAAGAFARDRILQGIQEDLAAFGVRYDGYFSEKSLHESGAVRAVVEELRNKGRVADHEGALWFAMEGGEDEKDRVLIRATGEPTYFAADAAYHQEKFRRGYDRLIDIWGSDHHGYVPRVKAAIEALGHAPDALRVLLVQFVTLVRSGRKLSMSTRSGEFITLREVLDEVGSDAARFFFLTKRSDSHLDFDLDLAKRQSKDNPVYYVQYAHARVASVFRIAEERGIGTDLTGVDVAMLTLPEEQRIIRHLADFPDMLAEAAEALEPHRITFYLLELAELFHAYYHDNRILVEDEPIKKARLYLARAVRQVVANGLDILGVSAPDRM
jgi:arginyl-tRNA synthetase